MLQPDTASNGQYLLFTLVGCVIGGLVGLNIAAPDASGGDQYPIDLSSAEDHQHTPLNTTGTPPPSVSVTAQPDNMKSGNFNLHIQTDNFSFAPKSVSQPHRPGEGHAHVFVDDVKIGRAYGPWFHVPKLKPGEHRIKVTLSTNDHKDYAVGGNIIQDAATVTVPTLQNGN